MKRLILGMLLVTNLLVAETIMANESELACPNKHNLALILDKFEEYKTSIKSSINREMRKAGGLRRTGCSYINEGMDLKVLKTKQLKLKVDKIHTKALLVKLPNGNTAYIAR
jgi:hypothetical protein